jgi:isocitrate dehydrogenase kinase/phosphatase
VSRASFRPPSKSRIGNDLAACILDAFVAARRAFTSSTRAARGLFEARDWAGLQAAGTARLAAIEAQRDAVEETIRERIPELDDKIVWISAKAVYSGRIVQRQDRELAETFFNSVSRRVFDQTGVDPLIEFTESDFFEPPPGPSPVEAFHGEDALVDLVARWIQSVRFHGEWVSRRWDAHLVADRVKQRLASRGLPTAVERLEVLRSPFFRGKGAYVVGRVVTVGGGTMPLILAVRNGPRGFFVDAVLTTEADVSVLFSFTRSYFFVHTPRPHAVVDFLQELVPDKPRGEIYISIGEPKQGKTELFRALADHLVATKEQYDYAPGTPGLVMVVFTAPELRWVLKVIRDHFPHQKNTTPAKVKERYGWVYSRDRAGRLVDAQPFEELVLPRSRFAPKLLEELFAECGKAIREDGDDLVFDLVYVERKLTPLDLYVRKHPRNQAAAALLEYGSCLMDMARSNIFPGDLLLKNFGVTDRGRVACYDYDELTELLDMVFRDMPEGDDEDEWNDEPWFAVGPRDVFPEEFSRFLGVPPDLRHHLIYHCPEIFDAGWWRVTQRRLREGKIAEFPPYGPQHRLLSPRDRL